MPDTLNQESGKSSMALKPGYRVAGLLLHAT